MSTHTRSTAAVLAAVFALAGCASPDDALTQPDLNPAPHSQDAAAEQSEEPEQPAEAPMEEQEPADAPVTVGTVCGEVTAENSGMTAPVVAIKDGADCATAVEVFTEYLSANPSGEPPFSTSAIWDAPNGWYCSKGYTIPGDPEDNASRQLACGPSKEDKAAAWIQPERVDEVK